MAVRFDTALTVAHQGLRSEQTIEGRVAAFVQARDSAGLFDFISKHSKECTIINRLVICGHGEESQSEQNPQRRMIACFEQALRTSKLSWNQSNALERNEAQINLIQLKSSFEELYCEKIVTNQDRIDLRTIKLDVSDKLENSQHEMETDRQMSIKLLQSQYKGVGFFKTFSLTYLIKYIAIWVDYIMNSNDKRCANGFSINELQKQLETIKFIENLISKPSE